MMQLLFRMFRRNTTTGKCTSHVLRRGFSVGARLGALALGALALLSCDKPQTPQGSRARVLNLYSWTDYFPPDLIADFQRETGIVVHHATFPSLEVLEAMLLTGHSGYDVVVTGDNTLQRLASAHVFRELDRSQLSNWNNLDPDVMARLATEDAGNRYAVAYDWGATLIGFNATKLMKIAPDAPFDSWRLIFDPAILSKFADCGVSVVDAPSELLAVSLMADGKSANSTDTADIGRAERKLMAIRPYVRKIDSDMQIADLASGDICLMVTWAPNVVMARRRAAESGNHDEFRLVIPKEGTDSYIDALAIPADAPHTAEAHAFINFMMRADIAARGADFLGLASANRAALPRIDKLLRDDPAIYPPPEARAKLEPLHSRPDAVNRLVTRIWTRFRTGR